MMKKIIGFIVIVLVLMACKKDTFNSKPSLKFVSMSGNHLPARPSIGQGYTLTVNLEYTDAEGDLAGTLIHYAKKSESDTLCLNPDMPGPSYIDTTSDVFMFPDVPQSPNQKGELVLTLTEDQFVRISCDRAHDTLETAVFKFWFKDKAGNPSDTVVTPPITIVK